MVASAQGRDYSSWQSSMDLTGLSFVFIRATYGDGSFSSTGPGAVTHGVDAKFASYWAQARAAGIHCGAYGYFLPTQSPAVQAKLFLDTVRAAGLKAGDMLAADSEEYTNSVDDATLAFCSDVQAGAGPGHPLLVYTNHNVGQHLIKTARAFPEQWFAYPSHTSPPGSLFAPWPAWRFWQWGWSGGVDSDAYNGTAADLSKWIGSFIVTDPSLPGTWKQITSVQHEDSGAWTVTGIGVDDCIWFVSRTAAGVWGSPHRLSGPVNFHA